MDFGDFGDGAGNGQCRMSVVASPGQKENNIAGPEREKRNDRKAWPMRLESTTKSNYTGPALAFPSS